MVGSLFLHGPMAEHQELIEAVCGVKPEFQKRAVLFGYVQYTVGLEAVPDVPEPVLGGHSLRATLLESWGPDYRLSFLMRASEFSTVRGFVIPYFDAAVRAAMEAWEMPDGMAGISIGLTQLNHGNTATYATPPSVGADLERVGFYDANPAWVDGASSSLATNEWKEYSWPEPSKRVLAAAELARSAGQAVIDAKFA